MMNNCSNSKGVHWARHIPVKGMWLAALFWGCAAQATTLTCGHLLDVRSGEWIRNAQIKIAEQRFESLGTAQGSSRQDGELVDLADAYCLPGLMDMHVHLAFESQPQLEELRAQLSFNPADFALRATQFAKRTLLAGFTTVRDVGASDGVDIALKKAIVRGWIEGPRMFVAGAALSSTGGHGDPTNGLSAKLLDALGEPGTSEGVVDGADAARHAVRARYKEGADLIKIAATGGVLSQASNSKNAQFTDDELRAIVETAKDYGMRVAAHAHGAEGMKRALRAGVDSIEHGTYMDEESIRLFKKNGAWFVPTLSAGRYVANKAQVPGYYSPLVRPKALAIGPLMQDTFARAYKAGVKIAFGTDAAVFPHGDNAKEFVYMVEAGMPPLEAIRSATLHAAELLGQADSLGQVAPGYTADLIAVRENPLENIGALQSVEFVMKAGIIYKNTYKNHL